MAEERLIDDDKDRKYKIRKNADGEDELVIDTTPDEDENAEEIGFEVPEFENDDEEAAVMTPEQLAAREKARKEAEAKKREQLAQYSGRARQLLAEEKFEDAAYVLEAAEDLQLNDGEVSLLKLRALTREFTEFFRADECADAVDGVKNYATDEVKAELKEYSVLLSKTKEVLEESVENLNKENEEKKDERRVKFKARRKSSLIMFAATAIPFLVFAVLAIYFSTIMHAEKDGSNITLFIIFVSVAGFFLLLSVFTARRLWQSVNYLKLNENNSSTKLGRELEEKKSQLALVNAVTEVIGNDIS